MEAGAPAEFKAQNGLLARAIHALGVYGPRTARLSNRVHWFCVETEPAGGAVGSEPGIDPPW